LEIDDGNSSCEACGYVTYGTVLLVSPETEKQIKINIDTMVGKYLLKTFVGEDYNYASEPQFKILKDAGLESWAISHVQEAINPTFLNGTSLGSEPMKLTHESVITIGPERMRIIVHIEEK
jgi:hypothetical protein